MLAIDLMLVKMIMGLAKALHNIFDISKKKNPPPFDVSPTPVLTGSAAWAVALYKGTEQEKEYIY